MGDCPRSTITIALSQPLMTALARMAHETDTTEDELIQGAVRSLVQARQGPAIPRFARRLGPIVLDLRD